MDRPPSRTRKAAQLGKLEPFLGAWRRPIGSASLAEAPGGLSLYRSIN